jgi:hypothetical protein
LAALHKGEMFLAEFGRRFFISTLLVLALWTNAAITLAEPEASTTKNLPMVTEQSVSTYIPSSAAPGRGLAVNIIYPEKPRYKSGAPVVVVVPGGDTANGLNFSIHAAQVGFVEVRFAFPGGGTRPFKSGGDLDSRGSFSQIALRDITLFSLGGLKDYRERTINDLVPVKVNTKDVGLVGWSNGGNIVLVTMDKFADFLQPVGWVAFYESPLGSMFYPSCLGSANDLLANRHYRQGSAAAGRCLIDFRKLAFDPEISRNSGLHKKLGEPDIAGVVYFDENGNKKWDESTEFAFNYSLDRGFNKQMYPPEVTAALERHKVFPQGWPATIATLKESEAFFQERDGAASIPSVCSKYPNLLVTVFGSHVDHLQRQPDHPHIVLQYNAWLENGAHWVRLNPEPIYPGQIANMSVRNFVNNKPNGPIDAVAIADHLEPEGTLKDYVFIEAAIAELADRKRSNNLTSPLDTPIVTYTNGLPVPPLAAASTANQSKSGEVSSGTTKTETKQ